jgi:branched-chain amino acid aminotransferase
MNGRIVAEEKAAVSVFDRGLNYGDGLFETMKADRGMVEFLKDHISRLKKGARFLGFAQGALKALELDIKNGAIIKLLEANGLDDSDAYLRITVTRGEDPNGHLPKRSKPTTLIVAKPIDTEWLLRLRTDGAKAILIRGYRPALPGIKTLNYLPSVIARAEAKKKGADEGIFVGSSGEVLEGTSSNIFIVSGGVVSTPPVSADPAEGVLPGVMRGAVMRLLRKKKIKVVESRLVERDLASCEEAFLTNSIWGVVPLIAVDGAKAGTLRPDEVTRLLQKSL